jgi:hypothetical protein
VPIPTSTAGARPALEYCRSAEHGRTGTRGHVSMQHERS